MARAKTTWGIGDYPRMALRLEPVATAAVRAGAVGEGARVLDIATGTGNAAIIAARQGAEVTAVDIEPVLIEHARRRARAARVEVRWLLGDLEQLPVRDASADVVLSVFGVMYSTDCDAAARELARVAAPGGRVVLASWKPGSAMPAISQAVGSFLPPPPPSSGSPGRWGDADSLRDILAETGLRLEDTVAGQVTFKFAGASEGASFLIATAGHIVGQRDRLMRLGVWGDLQNRLADLVHERAEPSDGAIALRLDYLVATAVRQSSR